MQPKPYGPLIPWDTFKPDVPTFVIGGGPSVAKLNPERLRGCQIVTTNNQYRLFPWATIHFAQDEGWWAQFGNQFRLAFTGKYAATAKPHRNNGEIYGMFAALVYNQTRNPIHYRGNGQVRDGGFDKHPDCLRGNNSGQSAINLAYHAGARLVILLGFDMRAVDGRCHWHEEKEDYARRAARAYETAFRPAFANAAPEYKAAGMRVINCTPGSALDCFERGNLDDWLPSVHTDAPIEQPQQRATA